jgi:hypothetical protein
MLAGRDRPRLVVGSGVPGDQHVLGVRDGLVDVREVPDPPGRIRVEPDDGRCRVDQHRLHPVRAKLLAGGQHHPSGDGGGLVDAADVQHDDVDGVGIPGEPADDRFRAGEQQVAVQLVHPGPAADPQQQVLLGGAAAAPGRPVDHIVGRPHRGPRGPADVQEVQLQVS